MPTPIAHQQMLYSLWAKMFLSVNLIVIVIVIVGVDIIIIIIIIIIILIIIKSVISLIRSLA
jgi:hypothetical protein